MRYKFDRNAYGKPPPRLSQPPKVVVEDKNLFVDEGKGQEEVQSNSIHKVLSAANTERAQNDSASNTSLKQDTSTQEAFVSPVCAQTPQPTAHAFLTGKTNISDRASPLLSQENTPTCVITQLSDPTSPSLASKENATRSLLLDESDPAFGKHGQESVTLTNVSGAGHLLDTRADGSGDLKLRTVRSNSNVGRKPKMDNSDPGIARGDQLKQLQDASLRRITRKTAARKEKDSDNTVSIRDLDLARTPVNVNKPKASFRTWAKDSPIYGDGYSYDSGTALTLRENFSIATQLPPSARTSHAQTTASKPDPAKTGRSKWAAKDEMKAETIETGSNQWNSAVPSDETHPSNKSDESFGKLLRNREPAAVEALYDWEGKLLPPPADWAERPRYNNNNPEFKGQFKHYIRDLQGRFSNGVSIRPVPVALLEKRDYHPDGIGMVHRTVTINDKNAARYGYIVQPGEAVLDAQSIKDSEYEEPCPLDPDDEANAQFDRDETTDTLVTNWNRHIANSRGERITVEATPSKSGPMSNKFESSKAKLAPVEDISLANEQEGEEGEEAHLTKPKLNIYLRPVTRADLSELTRIYNWYVVNGCQSAELRAINESAMQNRMDFCESGKFPFIVAACMSQKGARRVPQVDGEEFSRRHGLPVTHKPPLTLTRIENLAGFCCANDFSVPDFVEHIAADIEIYVDAQYRRMGVGKCLMDKMLEMCDRSHRLTMDVPFHCDPEIRHMYGPGGIRDIHKIIISLRKWHSPKAVTVNVFGQRKSKKLAFAKTQENDYAQWLKTWFESAGFEEEGCLSKIGARNGRYIDLVYLGRGTSWQPAEGKVPDPAPEFLVEHGDDEVEDD